MDLSEKEIATLHTSIKIRQKQIRDLHATESEKKKTLCACEASLAILEKIEYKLLQESGNESVDYSDCSVLLVDDVASAREYAKLLLQRLGFCQIDEADDGHTAIVKIKEKNIQFGKTLPYDLVLCDLNMPTISGIDVLKLIKKETKYSRIPFIIITGDKDKKNLIEAIEAGVSDYITKPINEVDFMMKLNKILR